ncbi:hypothetical protein DQY66_24680 [Salmonella enterica subsp. enterica serovar Utah]|nr:hypothetical protein [Salmonella enterica]EBX0576159.1 hypothetical protein [Salmonella enterica subsp. enterica serovar Utah]
MEFKDLPTEIQVIAAHTLRQRLNELELESVTKKDTDNMARNVRDAFTGLYSVSVTNSQDTEEAAKQIASKMGFYVKGKYSKKEFWKIAKRIAERGEMLSVSGDSFYNEKTDNSCLRDLLSLLDKFGIIMTGTALADFTYSAICHDGEPCPPELTITPGDHPRVKIRAIQEHWFNPAPQDEDAAKPL